MRQQQQAKENKKSMWLKWILLAIGLGVFMSFLYAFYVYQSIQSERTTGFDDSETFILDNTELVEIDLIEAYYGEETYHIIFGETKNNEQKIAFLPISDHVDDDNLTIIDYSKIVPEEEILNQINEQCQECQVKKINPAMIDDNPLWEITYRDQNNRYVFDYLSIYDGSRFERLQLKPMFK